MKKFLSLLLALALLLSFTACGKKDVTGDVTPGTISGNIEATEATEATEAAPEFAAGTINANVYANTFLGITCAFSADQWVIKTDEEMREINQQTLGLVGDDYAEMLKDAPVVYDFMATHINQADTIVVNLEKLSLVNMALTENAYLTLSKESMEGALASMGVENITATIGTMQFAGSEHGCIDLHGTIAGYDMYEKLVVIKQGGYMAVITACTWFENTCDAILAEFKAL